MIDIVSLDQLERKVARVLPVERFAQVNLYLLAAAILYFTISPLAADGYSSTNSNTTAIPFLVFAFLFTFAVAVFAARLS